jgi:hypothetical protein
MKRILFLITFLLFSTMAHGATYWVKSGATGGTVNDPTDPYGTL